MIAPLACSLRSLWQGMKCCLWLAMLLALSPSAWAQTSELATAVSAKASARYWMDEGTQATINEAWANYQEGRSFVAKAGVAGANYGFTRGAIWMALPIPPAQQSAASPPYNLTWVLSLDYPPLDDVRLYLLDAQGRVLQTQRAGDAIPFHERALPVRLHAFEWPAALGATLALVRTQSSGVVSLPVDLRPRSEFLRWLVGSYVVYALYLGLVVGLVAYNVVLAIQLRDPRFAWYCLFGVSMAGLQITLSGLGMQFLWPNSLWWQERAAAIFIAMSCIFALQFTRRYLGTPGMPFLDGGAKLLLGTAGGGLLLALFMPLSISTNSNSTIAAVSIVFVVGASVWSIRQSVPNSGKFLLAWAALLMGAVALLAHNNGLIATSVLTSHSLLVGSAMEMVLLSLCLGANVRIAHRQREVAEAKAQEERALVQSLKLSQTRNEALLAEREATLNNAVVGIVVSVNRQHVWINDKFVRMMGYERSEMLGRNAQYLYADPEEWSRFGPIANAALKEHGSFSQELRLKRKDASVIWALLAAAPANPNDATAGIIWTILDVTAVRQAEEQTRAALTEQRELTEARERFVAMTSHELRTPVASILGTLELFEHYSARLSDVEKADMLKQISTSAQRLWDLTERVLLHGKAQAGQLRFQPQQVVLFDLLVDVVKELCSQPSHPRDRLEVDWPNTSSAVRLDPTLVRHILLNLLSNAYKYSPRSTQVVLKAQLGADVLRLEVSDNGIGIPEADLAKVFDGFRRAGNVGDISGTGLGLSIVKHCVHIHRGKIELHSEQGRGTQIVVTLPVEIPAT